MNASAGWSLPVSLGLFSLATVLILIFGVMMTRVAARLAERSGLGETLVGALLLGATTSLPEIATSLTAAVDGHADLAVSNAVGSVAGQTAFLALADMAYRRANLEHAAASAENLLLGAFLIVMLAIPILGLALPEAAVWGIHPASLLMLAAYVQGIRMVSRVHVQPMWIPRPTRETRDETQSATSPRPEPLASLWFRFGVAAVATAAAGWLLARAAVPLSVHTGLSETLVGGVLTGLAGSLPELVTAVAAVRIGALSLAVGDILGGNCFDALIVAFTDLAYPGGSVYAAVGPHQDFLLALTVLLSAVLLMGMLYRERHGVGNIGLESVLLLVFYLGGIGLLVAVG
jgi:cation:H+ antiporter